MHEHNNGSRKRKKEARKPKAASQRRSDIRAHIAGYLDSLIKLYDTTDPALGKRSEDDKLERARQAVSIWWYLYGELMLWAQSHLAGYEFGKANPEFIATLADEFGQEITPDSHVLEYIGLQYSWNHVDYDDPMSERVQLLLDKKGGGLDEPALRRLIRELLMSRSANSSFWRFELQHALFNLNLGNVDDLFEPDKTRRQGNPAEMYYWKTRALQHVYYNIGKGLKKYRALQLVGDALGQSVETLRSWEKSISQNDEDDFLMNVDSSTLAGRLESELGGRHRVPSLEKKYGAIYHRHSSDIEYAWLALQDILAISLKDIRDGLRKARTRKKSGS
jgi:hypothetical protein